VGLDIGGTTVSICAIEPDGALITDAIQPVPDSDDPETMLAGLMGAASHLMGAVTQIAPVKIAGIGIGVPGTVSADQRVALDCPNLRALDGLDVPDRFEEHFGIPAFMHNDAYCAALGELRYGAGREYSNILVATLGTGVGGGIALDNRVVRGPRQILGEIGHIIIDPDGPPCTCGTNGCLEAIVGRDGIIAKAREGLANNPDSALSRQIDAVTPQLIAQLATQGDTYCRSIIDWIGECVGIALASATVVCDPDVILIGGGIAGAGHMLLDAIRATVGERSRISGFDPANVIACELGARAGAIGAAALVWEDKEIA
jgi:glucokinase